MINYYPDMPYPKYIYGNPIYFIDQHQRRDTIFYKQKQISKYLQYTYYIKRYKCLKKTISSWK